MERIIKSFLETLEEGIRKAFKLLLTLYKRGLSPLLGDRCRFYPTCSEYAAQTLSTKAIPWYLGLLFVIWRLLRCNPYFRGGVDLPPQRLKKNLRN